MQSTAPVMKDLVLLGGGHAHVAVLKAFGMRPIEGVRVTLINRDTDTPYSGMLPGLIAGHYTFDETHIDLGRLARFSQARFIHDEATGIDPENNRILFAARPPLFYDLLSIDTGSTPNTASVPGAADHATPLKPISKLLDRWERLCERALAADKPLRVAVAGAGAGGVETLLAAQYRLDSLRREADFKTPATFTLFSAASDLLPGFPASVRRLFKQVLNDRGIDVHYGQKVKSVEAGAVLLENGERLAADEILFATDAAAPGWIAHSGLSADERGFIKVNAALQSLSHPNIFAAGDVAAVENHARPKAGVFAVRQGPPLTRNLRRVLLGKTPVPYKPQSRFLSLVSTGDRYAVASRNGIGIGGAWVWRWKDWIDRRFMARFIDLPDMKPGQIRKPFARLPDLKATGPELMRCGGCGAKVGASTLSEALRDIQPVENPGVVTGLSSPDDAAVVRIPAGKVSVHTVDSFRALVEDPYIFGKIAANHALGDIFAMGAAPHTALAIATLPYASPAATAADLRQMMAGAVDILNAAGATLVGGHTAEGAEMALGFAINGVGDEQSVMHKGGLRQGDAIILTKALGTGSLFAADMQYKARSSWIEAAIASMLTSNGPAARCLAEHGAAACTDITGFGLAGHLGEMAVASGVAIHIDTSALRLLNGAAQTMARGIFSTLHDENVRNATPLFDTSSLGNPGDYPIVFDPQTAGGLVAGVPADRAGACISTLATLGYGDAAIIGRVAIRPMDGHWLQITGPDSRAS
ncbi:MAG: selenide, water dikinase SelD [Hyphomicrobiales bacterium]|nr:selenide, water dikinase SelD [Hyphomicrobiales bacterium]